MLSPLSWEQTENQGGSEEIDPPQTHPTAASEARKEDGLAYLETGFNRKQLLESTQDSDLKR